MAPSGSCPRCKKFISDTSFCPECCVIFYRNKRLSDVKNISNKKRRCENSSPEKSPIVHDNSSTKKKVIVSNDGSQKVNRQVSHTPTTSDAFENIGREIYEI